MTKFNKEAFNIPSGRDIYVSYDTGNSIEVVARFKYMNARVSAKDFIKFLVKNFEVEEYLNLLRAGVAPLTILETKGYVSYNMRQLIKYGYKSR